MKAAPAGVQIAEWSLRAGAAALLSLFWIKAFALWYADPAHLTLLLLLLTETLSVLLVTFNRTPQRRDWHPAALVSTLMATFYFLALQLTGGTPLLPESLSVIVISAGLSWQIYAKVSLGRAFGLLPGYRAIQTCGAYRFVRHPIYLGYLVCHTGFLMANASARNALVYLALYALQWMRMHREERLLEKEVPYRLYQARVRWRLIPGIY
jgi:protein-S-isoprenylcysteine O-methyltransferase Ste14